jgi:hypothetical protein
MFLFLTISIYAISLPGIVTTMLRYLERDHLRAIHRIRRALVDKKTVQLGTIQQTVIHGQEATYVFVDDEMRRESKEAGE